MALPGELAIGGAVQHRSRGAGLFGPGGEGVGRNAVHPEFHVRETVAAELHVDFGGIGVKSDIKIVVKSVEERVPEVSSIPTTRLLFEWEAATMPRFFPLMKGALSVYPLTSTETQLDFSGIYKPPFGTVGKSMNAIVGYRIAEVSVHRFVSDVAGYLRQTLG